MNTDPRTEPADEVRALRAALRQMRDALNAATQAARALGAELAQREAASSSTKGRRALDDLVKFARAHAPHAAAEREATAALAHAMSLVHATGHRVAHRPGGRA